ncbi:MAG: trimeric intracellular cation channel family protein [Woeseiaceae bacterium]|nr:trimeric intracellular cation channel family protein [Woeseiaceae bacterium]
MTHIGFLFVLEMLGTAAFAISGALAAARKGMDIFGFFELALVPAVGGGTMRDVILDRHPVFWIDDVRYVAVALAAAVIVYFSFYRPGGRQQVLIWMDAMGLALFATLATRICLEFETGAVVAVMLGVASAVTGGMIRDIICNEIPLILTREIYATAAFVSSVTFVGLDFFGIDSTIALSVAVIAGFTVRGLSIVFDWTLPAARPRS